MNRRKVDKINYPDYISKPAVENDGKSIFYFLEIECKHTTPVYKFGITCNSINRLHVHYRKLCVKSVIKIIDCRYDSVMRHVETEFKRYVKSIGVMATMFNQTEILVTDEILVYIAQVEAMIIEELKKPQPTNARDMSMKNCIDSKLEVTKTDRKCNLCGKEFKKPIDLARHNNRKLPCIVTNVNPEDLENSLRCIYCNKLLSTLGNLTKHAKNCKIKREHSTKIHVDVTFEEQLEMYRESRFQKIKTMQIEFQSDLADMKAELMDELEKLKISMKINSETP